MAADDAATAARLADGDRGAPVEKRLRHADGRLLWVRAPPRCCATPTVCRGGDRRDRGDPRPSGPDAELSRLALHDPLTGVRNRALLEDGAGELGR
jgi:GGDEF domain-containing protein